MSSVAVLTAESFAEHRSGLKDEEMADGVPADEAYIPTYLEAFPPLPEKGAPGETSGESGGAWSKIRPIKSSVITQVFHIPLEERRYKDNSQFGEGEEAKLCLDIMQKTGAHIELSLAKDQGLSIMVTGKLDSVMKARKEIVARLQTQVAVGDLASNIDYSPHRAAVDSVNRMKEQYKVCVRVPQDVERSSLVRIEGELQGVQLARKELLELSARMENERTRDLIIEQRFHRTIIGQKGEKIKEVRDKFPEVRSGRYNSVKQRGVQHSENMVIINFPDPAQKSDIVQLRGPKNEVEKCVKYLQRGIAELIENSFSISVPIFKQFHKNIIGKGGANIKKIREETNTKIDLPTENSNSEVIVITGKKPHCEAARDRILAIQRELANIKEAEVSIPARLHNSLIGAKGRLVRAVMEECGGAHIHFPAEGSGSDKVTIRGPVEEVERAKRQLLQLAEEKQINNYTVELQAKPEYHKFLIGRGGGNIRKVRDRTGARIIFPASEEKDLELITIVGKEEAVRLAQRELEELIKNLDNVIEDSMAVEPRYHRHFVSRRGQVLREIAEEYGGVTVSFPRTGVQSDRVTLKGAKDCVEAAKRRIQDIIQHLGHKVAHAGNRPHSLPLILILLIPLILTLILLELCLYFLSPAEQEEESPFQGAASADWPQVDILSIAASDDVGEQELAFPSDDMELLSAELILLIKLATSILKVPWPIVNISVPQPELQCDVIKITGLVESVERARLGLQERVKELMAEQQDRALRSFKLTISVDPKHHPKIIGRKGAVISQIRKDHDVNIQFPDKGEEQQALRSFKLTISVDPKHHPKIIGRKGAVISQIRKDHDVNIQFPDKGEEQQDLICITGYESSAEAARESIQRIVADLEEMVSEDVKLDHRVHARIIGGRGKAIRKLMDEFKVDIRFPQPGSDDPDRVTVTGLPEKVDNAIDHLLNLEEEYMMNVTETETMAAYMKPPSRHEDDHRGPAKGFVVRDAPWNVPGTKAPDMSSAEDFPTFGIGIAPKQTSAWGPKRF
ncbi:UNVERIFIED_CONTAM: hypothetical protein FKN15_010042 [Acipenser sinensis]